MKDGRSGGGERTKQEMRKRRKRSVFTPKIESLTSAAAAAAADFWCPSGINRTATAAAAATSSSRAATTAYESETELYSTRNFSDCTKLPR